MDGYFPFVDFTDFFESSQQWSNSIAMMDSLEYLELDSIDPQVERQCRVSLDMNSSRQAMTRRRRKGMKTKLVLYVTRVLSGSIPSTSEMAGILLATPRIKNSPRSGNWPRSTKH